MNDVRTYIALAVAVLAGLVVGLFVGGDDLPPPREHVHAEAADATTYTCSMHPQIRSNEPGQCPICGMDLVPVTEDEGSGSLAHIELSERAKALAQVRTHRVGKLGDASTQLRLSGRIEQDETGIRTVTSWTAGRIDRLHVATTGEAVRAGQTIATLYSPEIYTAHRDLLQAIRQLSAMSSNVAFARKSAEATVEAARQKLRLLGVSNQEITSMEGAEQPWTQIRIRTRFGGTVIERLVNEGAYVQAGTGIYRVADLSKLWVQLDAYEPDLPRLRLGQHVVLKIDALPDATLGGTVEFIDPVVDPVKRTARVRVEVPNDGELRPGMFVEATVTGGVESGAEAPLVVPATAPLFLGRRSVVYVELPGDSPAYEAREVTLGPRAGEVYPVLDGLVEGERVVVNGAFAIDADLQIRGGNSLMMRPDDEERAEATLLDVPDDFRTSLAAIVNAYLEVQVALAADDFEGARAAGKTLAAVVDKFAPEAPTDAAEVWLSLRQKFRTHAKDVDEAQDIDRARAVFRDASRSMSTLLHRFGNPTQKELRIAYCPMAFDNEGAEWIQATQSVKNSYFGSMMLMCGEIRETIAPRQASVP